MSNSKMYRTLSTMWREFKNKANDMLVLDNVSGLMEAWEKFLQLPEIQEKINKSTDVMPVENKEHSSKFEDSVFELKGCSILKNGKVWKRTNSKKKAAEQFGKLSKMLKNS